MDDLLRTARAFALLILLPLAFAHGALAQNNTVGDDNEFGVIRMPFQATMEGETLTIESRVVLRAHYEEQDTTYFMFAWSTEDAPPLSATFVSLKTAEGKDLKVYEKQNEPGLEKWFVDVKDMPPVGTEIVMTGNVDSNSKGFYPAATLVVPFNYRWEQITMTTGDQAKLYAFTNLGVNAESKSGGGSQFGKPGGGLLPVPAGSVALAVPAIAAAALALRRRA